MTHLSHDIGREVPLLVVGVHWNLEGAIGTEADKLPANVSRLKNNHLVCERKRKRGRNKQRRVNSS